MNSRENLSLPVSDKICALGIAALAVITCHRQFGPAYRDTCSVLHTIRVVDNRLDSALTPADRSYLADHTVSRLQASQPEYFGPVYSPDESGIIHSTTRCFNRLSPPAQQLFTASLRELFTTTEKLRQVAALPEYLNTTAHEADLTALAVGVIAAARYPLPEKFISPLRRLGRFRNFLDNSLDLTSDLLAGLIHPFLVVDYPDLSARLSQAAFSSLVKPLPSLPPHLS